MGHCQNCAHSHWCDDGERCEDLFCSKHGGFVDRSDRKDCFEKTYPREEKKQSKPVGRRFPEKKIRGGRVL